jgi:phage terminase large subunit-like protein
MSKRKLSRAEQLAALPAEDREAFWASLTDAEKAGLEFDWEGIWARPEQREPPGSWRTWMYLAGRGAGKTRTGAEWIRKNLTGSTPLAPGRYRHACLLAETAKDARSVVVGDGLEASNPAAGSGIMQICPKDYLPNYEPSKTRLTFPNGAVCSIFNAVEYDGLRGFQFDCAWVDELAKFAYAAQAWDQLQFCLRLGKNPRVFVSTTPRPTKLIKAILADPTTFVTRGSTFDNLSNLSAQFLDAMRTKYEGTRLGQQELHAAILEDVVGALWKRSDIDAARITVAQLPILRRVVVAVDPAVSSHDGSNETGITAVGIGEDDRFYVLDDISGVFSPDVWAREAISLYKARRADRIVCERNQGGELVEQTLRTIDPNVPISLVWASKGKFVRAEPCAALYEQRRVSHVGNFFDLEEQMCSFTIDQDRKAMGSPDRVDSLVWGLTSLMEEPTEQRAAFVSLDFSGSSAAPDWYTTPRWTKESYGVVA